MITNNPQHRIGEPIYLVSPVYRSGLTYSMAIITTLAFPFPFPEFPTPHTITYPLPYDSEQSETETVHYKYKAVRVKNID